MRCLRVWGLRGCPVEQQEILRARTSTEVLPAFSSALRSIAVGNARRQRDRNGRGLKCRRRYGGPRTPGSREKLAIVNWFSQAPARSDPDRCPFGDDAGHEAAWRAWSSRIEACLASHAPSRGSAPKTTEVSQASAIRPRVSRAGRSEARCIDRSRIEDRHLVGRSGRSDAADQPIDRFADQGFRFRIVISPAIRGRIRHVRARRRALRTVRLGLAAGLGVAGTRLKPANVAGPRAKRGAQHHGRSPKPAAHTISQVSCRPARSTTSPLFSLVPRPRHDPISLNGVWSHP